ncbi:MAG: peptidase U34 dipeptidase, partial [Parafannyhessea sp.]
LDALQKQLIAQQTTVDSVMQKTASSDRTALANTLFEQASQETYNKCKKLLDEMRAYLNGDQSTEFVPSDYDASTGDLKTSAFYATVAFAPVISGQPQSASYEQNASASDLKVTASIPDDVKGSDSKLSYKWNVSFVAAADSDDSSSSQAKAATATAGATLKAARATTDTNEGSTHSVDTSKVGTYTYTCTVTNTVNGQSVTSNPATIVVKAKAAEPTKTDTTTTTTTNTPTKKSAPAATTGKSGKVVSTGDLFNMAIPAAIAVAGVAIVVIAVVMRKRNHDRA